LYLKSFAYNEIAKMEHCKLNTFFCTFANRTEARFFYLMFLKEKRINVLAGASAQGQKII
jgi:hypothetical protein